MLRVNIAMRGTTGLGKLPYGQSEAEKIPGYKGIKPGSARGFLGPYKCKR